MPERLPEPARRATATATDEATREAIRRLFIVVAAYDRGDMTEKQAIEEIGRIVADDQERRRASK
jgi:hypothetical protein